MARQAHREVGDVDHLLDFALTLGADLPALNGHERAECGFFPAQGVADLTDYLSALRSRHHSPHFECPLSDLDRLVIVLDAGHPNRCNRLAGRRIDRNEVTAARLIDPRIRVHTGVHCSETKFLENFVHP